METGRRQGSINDGLDAPPGKGDAVVMAWSEGNQAAVIGIMPGNGRGRVSAGSLMGKALTKARLSFPSASQWRNWEANGTSTRTKSMIYWYRHPGSNGGPPDPQSGALTN